MSFEIDNDFDNTGVIIKVIGVGGGGGNAIDRMVTCLLYTSGCHQSAG